MAEEDLVFAKNRHFFGGIEPSNLHTFRVYAENGKVKIEIQLPPNTVVNGQTLCVVKGAVIRRKTSGYPENEFDGERVAEAALSGTMVDATASASGTYYYAAFPYSTQGVYNRKAFQRGRSIQKKQMMSKSSLQQHFLPMRMARLFVKALPEPLPAKRTASQL